MGFGLIAAGMISGAGQAVGKSLNDLQHTFSEESLIQERARLDELRQQRQHEFLASQSTLAYERSETAKDTAIKRVDTEAERVRKRDLDPARIQEDVAGQTEKAKAQLQGKEQLRPQIYSAQLQDKFDALKTELETAAESGNVAAIKAKQTLDIRMNSDKQMASDPAWLKAEGVLANAKQTDLQKLQTQAERFKVDHLSEDRQRALDHDEGAMAATILKTSSTEIGRLTIDLVKLESSLTADDPDTKRHIANIKRQIADETLWQNSARTRMATLSKMTMTAPTVEAKTTTWDKVLAFAEAKGIPKEQAADIVKKQGFTITDEPSGLPEPPPDKPEGTGMINRPPPPARAYSPFPQG